MASPVSLDIKNAIARLRIENAPLNILTVAVRKALLERVLELEARSEIRVVILEAAGARAFSVGSDIREFPPEIVGGLEKIRFEQFLLERLEMLPQITIAKLRGHVLGGGGELMLACDFRIADESTSIGFPEILLGALPAAGGIKRLVRDIGPVRARELICRGSTVDGPEAASIGLINSCVSDAELDAAVDALARELSERSGDALRLAKTCIRAAAGSSNVDTVEADAFAELYRGSNLFEGLRAFTEKRPARFNR